jgi:sarcosine oxidase
LEWRTDKSGVFVKTNKGNYQSGKIIFTAGAYIRPLLKDFQHQFTVTRQLLAWMNPKDWEPYKLNNFPCWVIEEPETEGIYYGFPILPIDRFQGPIGLKIGHHRPGEVIDPKDKDVFDGKHEEQHLL